MARQVTYSQNLLLCFIPPGPSPTPHSPGLHASLPSEAARCPIPRTLRRPPRVQCGAPPARGQSRERSRRRARARLEGRAGRGARATPTRARPRGSRGQSARAGGAEPSAGLVHWPGAHRPTRGGSWGGIPPRSQVCKLGQKTAAHRWRKRGNSGPVRAAGSHGGSTAICLLRLQVPSCARPRLLQAVYFTVAQQLRVLTSTAERQRPGQISFPIVPCGETPPLGLRAGAPNPKSFDFCHGELRLGWKMGGRQAGRTCIRRGNYDVRIEENPEESKILPCQTFSLSNTTQTHTPPTHTHR